MMRPARHSHGHYRASLMLAVLVVLAACSHVSLSHLCLSHVSLSLTCVCLSYSIPLMLAVIVYFDARRMLSCLSLMCLSLMCVCLTDSISWALSAPCAQPWCKLAHA